MGFMNVAMSFATQHLRQKTWYNKKFDDRIHFHDKNYIVEEITLYETIMQLAEKAESEEKSSRQDSSHDDPFTEFVSP